MEKEITPGAEFLDSKYPDLKKSEQVNLNYENSGVEDTEIDDLIKSMLKEGGYSELSEKYEMNQEKKNSKMDSWLNNAEEFHKRHRDEESMDIIKEAFHNEYVIKKDNFPESYFEYQKKLAREQGHGDIEITEQLKEQGINTVVNDQESTLDNWVDYLMSNDADAYPMWAKYWALRSMTKLSSYDKEKKSFGNRRKDTTAPFPDLNREALAYVVDLITKKANNENIEVGDDNPELQKLLESENFGQFYAYAIEKVTSTEKNELEVIEGEWIKYDQGSDHMPLVESLQGHATGWCTAGESTAKTQLSNGDFYVYYSKDKEGNNAIPRVAIRMQGRQIGEVRGIGPNQNMDPYIGEVAQSKLQEFPDHKNYDRKTADMKLLTEIEEKRNNNKQLTVGDLKFLYEINSRIEGFGYQRDPRIEEIKGKRTIKEDISLATGFSKEEISTTERKVLSGVKFHFGNLDLRFFTSIEGLKLPETIIGNLDLRSLTSIEGLKLPETIDGFLDLRSLTSIEGLKLPETINGFLDLSSLTSAEGLKLPETINGFLDLSSLTSAEGLKLPETINGNLRLDSLTSANGLKLPETIGDLHLDNLTSANGLKLPETIGDLHLDNLTSAEGLNLPEIINGSLCLFSLTSANGLKLPKSIGALFLGLISSAEGLKLPETIGNLYLNSLTSAEGLKLPETIGDLHLNSLTSAEGLKLPETINGNLNLNSLTSAEGLKLPETINGNLNLYSLIPVEGLNISKNIGGEISLGTKKYSNHEKYLLNFRK